MKEAGIDINQFVTIKKFAQMSGLSEEAIRQYIKKGSLVTGVHWFKGTNGRNMLIVKAVNQWLVNGKA
ncbi:MerR family transcriptional regulator [Thiolinea disciformis]|uniref:MerR family transcriptional regulator n=1 Tax=Thiolinea disciformis TaxID=125614 RepID=UPI000365F7A8|nr:hypothetical protein [Thiolinea disciformis]